MIILYLTCSDRQEAGLITDALLAGRLIACSRQCLVSSVYIWKDKLEQDDEILLMMESLEEKFDAIDKVVSELHSHENYVLTAVRVYRTTAGVEKWLKDSLGSGNISGG